MEPYSRIRYRTHRSDNEYTYYRTQIFSGSQYGQTVVKPLTGLDFMMDWVNPEYKQLGKTPKDIGSPLFSQSLRWENVDWKPFLTCRNSDPAKGGEFTHFLPKLYNVEESPQIAGPASDALKQLQADPTRAPLAVWETIVMNNRGPDRLTDGQMDSIGSTAISRVNPINPHVDTATTVAELISEAGFFSLPGTNDSLSGEYLNYALGIAPTVGYASDLRKTIEKAETLLKQYERDSGRRVRRRYVFEPETEVVTTNITAPWNGLYDNPDYYSVASMSGSVIRKTKIESWFSGAFTYVAPDPGLRRTLAELDVLYGIRPGIDTAWELLPFSFVADYFSNVGEVLKNISAFSSDGLVMPYGYVMRTTTRSYEFDCRLQYGNNQTRTLRPRFVIKTQQRHAANPFGFGVLDSSLTGRQMSILAALGLSAIR